MNPRVAEAIYVELPAELDAALVTPVWEMIERGATTARIVCRTPAEPCALRRSGNRVRLLTREQMALTA